MRLEPRLQVMASRLLGHPLDGWSVVKVACDRLESMAAVAMCSGAREALAFKNQSAADMSLHPHTPSPHHIGQDTQLLAGSAASSIYCRSAWFS